MLIPRSFTQVQLERLAGVGVAGRCLPVPLVVAVSQVLQARGARRVFFNQVGGCASLARQAERHHADAGQVCDRSAEGFGTVGDLQIIVGAIQIADDRQPVRLDGDRAEKADISCAVLATQDGAAGSYKI